MSLVNVRVLEGISTAEQKREIIHRVTEAVVEVLGESLRPVTWVVIDEVKSGDWGIGGNPLTSADVRVVQRQAG